MASKLPSVEQQTYNALALWRYLRPRWRDYAKSWDFKAALLLGCVSNVFAFSVPRPHGMTAGYFALIVSTFAILGGFFGTSLSVLIGLIPRPVAAQDRLQYLNVIADFCFSVAIVFATVIGWLTYISAFVSEPGYSIVGRAVSRTALLFLTCYAAMLPFSAVQRLFRISGAATIAEEVEAENAKRIADGRQRWKRGDDLGEEA